jgi:PiT family inorganic phosphate transporter
MRTIAFGLVLLMQLWAGANDGGNLVATAIGARTVRIVVAFVILFGTVLLGPVLLGTSVAHTIVHSVVVLPPRDVPVGLAGAMSGAIASVLAAYSRRVPTSLSLAVVGGLIGGALALPHAAVQWGGVVRVVLGLLLALAAGFALGLVAYRLLARLGASLSRTTGNHLVGLQPYALALQGLAYGANDSEKALGLLVWVVSGRATATHVPALYIGLSGVTWIVGTLVAGSRVAASVGLRVFRMRPLHALAVQGSAGLTVTAASLLGLPVSTTQTIDAALMGVGASDQPRRVHWRVVQDMAVALGTTAPLAAVLAFVATRLIL